jgi:hypothetical protein
MGVRSNFARLFSAAAAMAIALAAGSAAAADYPTKKEAPPAPAPIVVTPITPGFFVKAGFLYAVNQSSSKLSSQIAPGPAIRDSGARRDVQQCGDVGLGGRLLRDAECVD